MVKHSCYWSDPPFPFNVSAGMPQEIDLVIVGGGLAGLTTLYYLLVNGCKKSVVLLEKFQPGSKASGRCAGQLVLGGANSFFDIDRERTFARVSASILGNTLFQDIVEAEDLHCDFSMGGGFRVASSTSEMSVLKMHAKYLPNNLNIEVLNMNDVKQIVGAPESAGGLFIPEEAVFDPYKLIIELYSRCHQHVICNAPVRKVTQKDSFLLEIEDRGYIRTKEIVYCTSVNTQKFVACDAQAVRNQVLLTEPWDNSGFSLLPDTNIMLNDMHFKKFNGRLMVGGLRKQAPKTQFSTTHDGVLMRSVYDGLSAAIHSLYPSFGVTNSHAWSYVTNQTSDGFPLVGRIAPGIYVNTGYDTMDANLVFLGAGIIRDQILNTQSDLMFAERFNPTRL